MKIPLKFNSKGNFKIVQFTDIHEGPEKDKSIRLMGKILNYEKPDFVVLTGDNIDGKCKTSGDVKQAINNIAQPMENREIPWAIVFGNHDDEHNVMNKEEMMKVYMEYKYNISDIGYKTWDRIGNYNIIVEAYKEEIPKLNIYMIDSGKYDTSFIGGYDWIKFTQICWYRKIAKRLKYDYKRTIPALMFFHIPLKNFKKAWDNEVINGERFENECPAKINLCLFNNVVKIGDVKGIFTGHDHLNNYCAVLNKIKLGYGGYTGYGGYGQDNVPRGARVFLIDESSPDNFKTWVRRENDIEIIK